MTEQQFQTFIYCCKSVATTLHFIDSKTMTHLISSYKVSKEETYEDVVARHWSIVKELHAGVCFSMACYTKILLEEMEIEEAYLMTSFSSNWPNTVIIYEYQGEYLVCDLAAQTLAYEKVNRRISDILINKSDTDLNKDLLKELFQKAQDIDYVAMTLPEYFKEYPQITCNVIMHKGKEQMSFEDVPRMPISDFLKMKEKENNINKI